MTTTSSELLEADLRGFPVQVGVLRGWWSIDRLTYPELLVTFAVPAAAYAPARLTIALDCTGFPNEPPTGRPVDPMTGSLLEDGRRPKHGRCAMTFRTDWAGGRALYLPVDRVAINSHPGWRTTHAHELWDPAEGIVQYLRMVRRDLTEGKDASLLDAA